MMVISAGLCQCGCGGETQIAPVTSSQYGWKKGHPKPYLKGHRYRTRPSWVVTDLGYTTPCWIWTARESSLGYGVHRVNGKDRRAHRVIYEQFRGPIPDGLVLDHLCRNTLCVNPDHLEPVTNGENVLRGVGPAALNARKTHCKRGHEFTPENTYTNGKGRRWCRTCHRIDMAERRADKADIPHGTPSGYFNRSCRCDACREAGRIYRQQRKEAA